MATQTTCPGCGEPVQPSAKKLSAARCQKRTNPRFFHNWDCYLQWARNRGPALPSPVTREPVECKNLRQAFDHLAASVDRLQREGVL